jgi:predicted DNA-binding transcriptional regulator YafY
VQDAVSRDRKLAFTYRRASGELVERVVDPLGLVAKGATWYLVANTPNGFRTYRVSRIERPLMLEQACIRPHDFDLAAYWRASTTEFLQTRVRYPVLLRLHPQAAARVRSWRMCAPADVAGAEDSEGWVTLRLHFEDEDQALFVSLGFGAKAQVLEPESLRRRLRDELLEMTAEPVPA